jgi:hypothetical protein
MGKRELRQMPTASFRLCGHCSTGPRGVWAQSVASRSAAVSEEARGGARGDKKTR